MLDALVFVSVSAPAFDWLFRPAYQIDAGKERCLVIPYHPLPALDDVRERC